MSEKGSVTIWLNQLKAHEQDAIQELWKRYFERLVKFAERVMSPVPRTATDGEDVALSAFFSMCNAIEAGRFPRLDDRNDLWQILVVLTRRKAISWKKFESREKRDYRRLQQQFVSAGSDSVLSNPVFEELISVEPNPAFAAEIEEQFRVLLDKLPKEDLRRIAELKLQGYKNAEIAQEMKCDETTIERKLQIIRKCWEPELSSVQPQ